MTTWRDQREENGKENLWRFVGIFSVHKCVCVCVPFGMCLYLSVCLFVHVCACLFACVCVGGCFCVALLQFWVHSIVISRTMTVQRIRQSEFRNHSYIPQAPFYFTQTALQVSQYASGSGGTSSITWGRINYHPFNKNQSITQQPSSWTALAKSWQLACTE